KNDPAFAQALARLGECYVNDAFGTAHRAHASTEGVTHYVKPAVAGFLMKTELDYLGTALENPKHPFVAVLGGAKISGKIDVLTALLGKVDRLLVGGAMMFTFLKAQGKPVGRRRRPSASSSWARTRWAWTSAPRRWPRSRRSCATRRPWSGTAPWASSRCRHSPRVRWAWRRRWRRSRRRAR